MDMTKGAPGYEMFGEIWEVTKKLYEGEDYGGEAENLCETYEGPLCKGILEVFKKKSEDPFVRMEDLGKGEKEFCLYRAFWKLCEEVFKNPHDWRGLCEKSALFCCDYANNEGAQLLASALRDQLIFEHEAGLYENIPEAEKEEIAPLTTLEAWETLRHAMHNAGWRPSDSKPVFEALPKEVRAVVGSYERLYDWAHETDIRWLRKMFVRTYEAKMKKVG